MMSISLLQASGIMFVPIRYFNIKYISLLCLIVFSLWKHCLCNRLYCCIGVSSEHLCVRKKFMFVIVNTLLHNITRNNNNNKHICTVP